MGRERAWERKHIRFYITGIIILVLGMTACTHLPVLLLKSEGERLLERADILLAKGEFDYSLVLNEEVLKRYPEILGDRALYRIGLIYMHPGNEKADEQKALKAFQRVLGEYPESDYREEVLAWISMFQRKNVQETAVKDCAGELKMVKAEIKSKDDTIHTMGTDLSRMEDTTRELEARSKDLKKQIENLKKVDMGIEKKKRRSPKP
jgi:tetratricopeptide (TPR) repeat protein